MADVRATFFSRYLAKKRPLRPKQVEKTEINEHPAGRPYVWFGMKLLDYKRDEAASSISTESMPDHAVVDTGFNRSILLDVTHFETLFSKQGKVSDSDLDLERAQMLRQIVKRTGKRPRIVSLNRGPALEFRCSLRLLPFQKHLGGFDKEQPAMAVRPVVGHILISHKTARALDKYSTTEYLPYAAPRLPVIGTRVVEDSGMELLVAGDWFSFYRIGSLNKIVRIAMPHANVDPAVPSWARRRN